MKNSDFSAIVTYQEQAREKSLKDLLDLPYTRVSLGLGQGEWLGGARDSCDAVLRDEVAE